MQRGRRAGDRRAGEVAGSPVVRAVILRAAGRPRRRSACAIGQRVRKRQPDGGSIGLGTSPVSTILLLLRPGTGSGIRREQRHRVRVQRPGEQLVGRRDLDDPAEVHHGDPVGDVADDREVVGDEDVGEVELLLQVDEQVQHLRLDRDVEGRDRLVGDDELRLQHERPGEADALPLAAAELVRVAAGRLRRHADALEHLVHDAVAVLAAPRARGSPAPPRSGRRPSSAGRASRPSPGRRSACAGASASSPSARGRGGSTPSKVISPSVGSSSRRSVRPRVDLPQPDSPTRPTVSPRRISRSTPSTAWR